MVSYRCFVWSLSRPCVGLQCTTEHANISFRSFVWWLQSLICLHSVLYCSRCLSKRAHSSYQHLFHCSVSVYWQTTNVIIYPGPVCVPRPYTYCSELPYSRCVSVKERMRKGQSDLRNSEGEMHLPPCVFHSLILAYHVKLNKT